jgi:hypothetical protein
MVAVRFAALAALVVWLGGILAVLFGDALRRDQLITYACGGVVFLSLLVMKFVGPPPHAFVARAGLTAAMLLLAAAATLYRTAATELMALSLAVGLVLLFWYVKES